MTNTLYKTKAAKLSGASYRQVRKKALAYFALIKKRTKRKPYIRSAYFKRDKIFFDNLWEHIFQKREAERTRRLKLLACAIELIRHDYRPPETRQSSEKRSIVLHRFIGTTNQGDIFYVQIQEHKPTGRKQLMSVFPGR